MQTLSNLLLNTDSYKASHWLQYPPGTDATFFYVESRGGIHDRTVFFGLQAILKEYLATPVTHADVDEARDVVRSIAALRPAYVSVTYGAAGNAPRFTRELDQTVQEAGVPALSR